MIANIRSFDLDCYVPLNQYIGNPLNEFATAKF